VREIVERHQRGEPGAKEELDAIERAYGERLKQAAMATTGDVLTKSGFVPDRVEGAQIAHPCSQTMRAAGSAISRRTQQHLDALARRRPDLLDEVRSGRLSAHRAAIQAGIVNHGSFDGLYEAVIEPWLGKYPELREIVGRYQRGEISVEDGVAQIELGRRGGDRRSEAFQVRNTNLKPSTDTKDYAIARLRRDRPDLAARVGERLPNGKRFTANRVCRV